MIVLDASAPEVILALPGRVTPTRHMRSTILQGSVASLRQAGHFERYRSALDEKHRDTLLQAVAGVWIPVEVAMAHYRACESLWLAPEVVVELGRSTFDKTGSTLFSTILRLAKGAGVSPWTVLPQLQRFWDRGYDGGGIRVARHGPKDARMELVQCAIADSPYFRYALRGVIAAVLQMFCSRVYVMEVGPRAAGSLSLRAQWA